MFASKDSLDLKDLAGGIHPPLYFSVDFHPLCSPPVAAGGFNALRSRLGRSENVTKKSKKKKTEDLTEIIAKFEAEVPLTPVLGKRNKKKEGFTGTAAVNWLIANHPQDITREEVCVGISPFVFP
jgi:hypothetical protein